MFVEKFFNQIDNKVEFTRKQASDFAKQIADDFNPLHNVDAKRFCVPGDLLFAVILNKAGLCEKMAFKFSGMVTDGIALNFPEQLTNEDVITDANEKQYLTINSQGTCTKNTTLIESLIKAYVGFSGHTFPHILCDLMAKNDVMINPARPMVMYESMSIEMFDISAEDVSLELSESTLTIDGKRGNACLAFNLFSDGKQIGRGEKHMVLSGLRPYCSDTISKISEEYMASKASYHHAA
ncbi:DUF3581 domain-containing protein [Thalassotalea sp. M1531]|uniref:DUF3581 domain-containing protein n=1 Tax=Thalassotalea algicola TaxID=2716224 RepID=A0A7Y0LEU7_9GAMM|nr:DUF3581 family protein [Thalassotalea algicola]NMP31870.1 DUF3581 domain-containing protein [Thalassotalea algicola]